MEQQQTTRRPQKKDPRPTYRERKRRRRLRLLRNWAIFLGVCAALVALMTTAILWLLPRVNTLLAGPKAFEAARYDDTGYTVDFSDARLVLVNANLPLEEEPAPQLETADEATGQQLEAEAAEAYRSMAEAAAQDGVTLTLIAGYQDEAAREAAFDAAKQNYLAEGRTEADAEARAATVVPQPAASEYATGYAADLLSADYSPQDTGFAETRAYEWLTAYAAEYGFILRWPEDRQAATGMVYEPWHWRYVGVENALAIRASGLSLEEFLALERVK